MAKVFTVTEINTYVSGLIREDFATGNEISVSGEVVQSTYHSTGIYFSIGDSNSKLLCVALRYSMKNIKTKIEAGKKVIVKGKIDIYLKSGQYQINVRTVEESGTGDEYAKYLELKNRLEEMGMFDSVYKRPIPKYASVIGVVTASAKSGGAASGDIINAAKERNPYVQIVQYNARVQGDMAPGSIANGVRVLDEYGVDVIIVGRGGGSTTDLAAFNTEIVARAIFECNTPVISAVGHNINVSISDLVADATAITPTAAAAMAVFSYSELMQRIEQYQGKIDRQMNVRMKQYRDKIQTLEWKIEKLSPKSRLDERQKYIENVEKKLLMLMSHKIMSKRNSLDLLQQKLYGLSPLNKLSGGYAYITNQDSKPITTISEVQNQDIVKIQLRDGEMQAVVTSHKIYDRITEDIDG